MNHKCHAGGKRDEFQHLILKYFSVFVKDLKIWCLQLWIQSQGMTGATRFPHLGATNVCGKFIEIHL